MELVYTIKTVVTDKELLFDISGYRRGGYYYDSLLGCDAA
jgi:hypothetical protein